MTETTETPQAEKPVTTQPTDEPQAEKQGGAISEAETPKTETRDGQSGSETKPETTPGKPEIKKPNGPLAPDDKECCKKVDELIGLLGKLEHRSLTCSENVEKLVSLLHSPEPNSPGFLADIRRYAPGFAVWLLGLNLLIVHVLLLLYLYRENWSGCLVTLPFIIPGVLFGLFYLVVLVGTISEVGEWPKQTRLVASGIALNAIPLLTVMFAAHDFVHPILRFIHRQLY